MYSLSIPSVINKLNYELLEKQLIIFGTGLMSNRVLQNVLKNQSVLFFVDNDPAKQGKNFLNREIRPIEALDILPRESYALVIAVNSYEPIVQQLAARGIYNAYTYSMHFTNEEYHQLSQENDNHFEPSSVEIVVSHKCNLECIYCLYQSNLRSVPLLDRGVMTRETCDILMRQIEKMKSVESVSMVGFGEIFTCPDWDYILKSVFQISHVKNIVTSTNGMLLTDERIEKIQSIVTPDKNYLFRISIDGLTPKENDRFRVHSNYETIRNNIYRARKALPSYVDFSINNNYIVKSLHEIEMSPQGFRLPVPTYLKQDFPDILSNSCPTYCFSDLLKQFEQQGFIVNEVINSKFSYLCCYPFTSISVNCHGFVTKCACGNHSYEIIGDIRKNTLSEIYNNSFFGGLRDEIYNNKQLELCSLCPQSHKTAILLRP